MDLPEEITPESAQKLLRMAEELMVTRQALEHALEVNKGQDMTGAKAALNSVVISPTESTMLSAFGSRMSSPSRIKLIEFSHFGTSRRCQSALSTPLCS